VGGGCTDLGRETHWANSMDVAAKYGDVVEVGEAVGEVERVAGEGRG